MSEQDWLAIQFEATRPHLRGVAYRMLGSLNEAEDAVQETWLRVSGADTSAVANLAGWLTTVVSRLCLDMLRARAARAEVAMSATPLTPPDLPVDRSDPESEAALADSVGVAMLIVLDTLSPAERIAFVLHDIFAMPFEEIATIMSRSLDATKQLASRARRRVRGSAAPSDPARSRQSAVVKAFLNALRTGDLQALLNALDPDAALHIEAAIRHDAPAHEVGLPREIIGAARWAAQFMSMARGMQFVQMALVDDGLAVVFAPRGVLTRVLKFSFADDRISRVEAIGDRVRLREMTIAVLD
ncbi:MAG: sigma-70 family RNA polymerase sigma factor [Gemmatimonas sp.]